MLVHAGLLAWGLFHAQQLRAANCLASCGALAGTAALALLLIFWIAAFGSRRALALVVLPALLAAGAWVYVTLQLAMDGAIPRSVLAGLVGFGALSVAVILSFGSVAIAARSSPPRRGRINLGGSPPFWVGALGLAGVLGVSAASHQVAPAATAFAAIGIAVLGASLRGAEKGGRQDSGMAELVNSVTLSLGAVWAASIVAGASAAADELGDWSAASTAMRFAWLAAMPLVLAAVVALAPRASATGLGIRRSRAAVITTATGVIVCMALGKVVLARTSPLLVAASQVDAPSPIQTSSSRPVRKPEPPPALPKFVPSPSPASAGAAARIELESIDAGDEGVTDASATPDAVPEAPAHAADAGAPTAPSPDAGGEAGQIPEVEAVGVAPKELALSHDAEQSRVNLRVTISGPMSADVARQGVTKSFRRLVPCYEGSELEGKPAAARVQFAVNAAGGVRNVDFVAPQGAPAQYVTCVQLAFLRTGFQMSPDKTELDISIDFAPTD